MTSTQLGGAAELTGVSLAKRLFSTVHLLVDIDALVQGHLQAMIVSIRTIESLHY